MNAATETNESNLPETIPTEKILSDPTPEERIIILSANPNISDTTIASAFAERASIEKARFDYEVQKQRQITRRMGIIAGFVLGLACITLLIVRGEMIQEMAGTAGIVGTVTTTAVGIVAFLLKGNNNSKKGEE